MMTGWPSRSVSLGAMMRATTSTAPPAVNGTTILMGRSGNADAAVAVTRSIAAMRMAVASGFTRRLIMRGPLLLHLGDDLSERLQVILDDLAKLLGAVADRTGSGIDNALAQVRRVHRADRVGADLLQHVGRHFRRGHQREPGIAFEARQTGLRDGRHRRHVRVALRSGDAEGADLSGE